MASAAWMSGLRSTASCRCWSGNSRTSKIILQNIKTLKHEDAITIGKNALQELGFQLATDNIDEIIKKESWLDPKNFIAYELKNGKAKKIMNDKLGQINENMIDMVSDSFSDEFDKLLDL